MTTVNITVDELVIIICSTAFRTAYPIDTAIWIIKIKLKSAITFCTVCNVLIDEHKRCAVLLIGRIIGF